MHAALTANHVRGRGKVKTKAELRALCDRHWLLAPPPAAELPPEVLAIVVGKVMHAEIAALAAAAPSGAEARKVCMTLGRLRCASRGLREAFGDDVACWAALARAMAAGGNRLARAEAALGDGKVSPRQVAVALMPGPCECGCGRLTRAVHWPYAIRCVDRCLRRNRVVVSEHELCDQGVPVDRPLRVSVPYRRFDGEIFFARCQVLAHMRERFGLAPGEGLADVLDARRRAAYSEVAALATEEQLASTPALLSPEELEHASISFYVFLNVPHWRHDGYRFYSPARALEEALAAAAISAVGA